MDGIMLGTEVMDGRYRVETELRQERVRRRHRASSALVIFVQHRCPLGLAPVFVLLARQQRREA